MAGQVAIGVDVGGTHIRAARVSATGDILDWMAAPTPDDPQEVTAKIADIVRPLATADAVAIGVGVPGRVDVKHERVLSGGFVDLAGQSLTESLRQSLGLPVFIDNDGNMALVAEHAVGAARGSATALLLTIGTGIGGAVYTDGKLLRGRASAGQLGHLSVDADGVQCLCGRRGCVETTSSGTALGRHLADVGFPANTSIDILFEMAAQGEALSTKVFAMWAAPMRAAIDTVVAAFDPDIVVLGGGLGTAMHRALAAFPAQSQWYQCPVVPAHLGDRAGVIGAGLAGLSHIGQ